MRVQMNTTSAGPEGVFLAGRAYDLPPKLAREFIEAGAAQKGNGEVEAAAVEPMAERAVQAHRRRGPRKRQAKKVSGE